MAGYIVIGNATSGHEGISLKQKLTRSIKSENCEEQRKINIIPTTLSITKSMRNKANRMLFSADDYVGDESMIDYDNESV
ncbi:hypothetical protein V1478_015081 [Vespula squamosa]|uniref:Uncharacterized protein n=1 Tax=Vespula squamosa TaxID=30214 RepID=A0ABD2A425_VESSQ